jgi:hypothetical protein
MECKTAKRLSRYFKLKSSNEFFVTYLKDERSFVTLKVDIHTSHRVVPTPIVNSETLFRTYHFNLNLKKLIKTELF